MLPPMKLHILSVLIFITCSQVFASETVNNANTDTPIQENLKEENIKVVEDELMLSNFEPWDVVGLRTNEPLEETCELLPNMNSKTTSSSNQSGWRIFSMIGNVFSSQPSPLQRMQSNGLKAAELVALLNCKPDQLIDINSEILKKVSGSVSTTRIELLFQLTEIGDRPLFELYFRENVNFIFTEIRNSADFHNVVAYCIKINSLSSFFNAILNQTYSLNGPKAIILSVIYDSADILRFFINQKNIHSDCDWEWKFSDSKIGNMFDYGIDSYSASMFLGALYAIERNHTECLDILIKSNLNIESEFNLEWNEYRLLKYAVETKNMACFEMIYNSMKPQIPTTTMNEILFTAITSDNIDCLQFLFHLGINYTILPQKFLKAAIDTKNCQIVELILQKVPSQSINSKALSYAALNSNDDIFAAILNQSSSDHVSNSLAPFITDLRCHKFVPSMIEREDLSSKAIDQGLVNAVRFKSVLFVNLLLSKEKCSSSLAKPAFLVALDSNEIELLMPFIDKYPNPSDLLNLNQKNNFSALLERLFEAKHWESLHALILAYFQSPSFPKLLFMSLIMETDQVELAKTACMLGGTFPLFADSEIQDEKMLEFVLSKVPGGPKIVGRKTRK